MVYTCRNVNVLPVILGSIHLKCTLHFWLFHVPIVRGHQPHTVDSHWSQRWGSESPARLVNIPEVVTLEKLRTSSQPQSSNLKPVKRGERNMAMQCIRQVRPTCKESRRGRQPKPGNIDSYRIKKYINEQWCRSMSGKLMLHGTMITIFLSIFSSYLTYDPLVINRLTEHRVRTLTLD